MLLWRQRMASIIFHQNFTLLTLDISNSLIRIHIDYEVFRQKYLHAVHFPSLSVVLNSPDDSFFKKKKTLSAQSDLIYSQKRTSALFEANMFQCWESSLST